jgi:hypothetical protein
MSWTSESDADRLKKEEDRITQHSQGSQNRAIVHAPVKKAKDTRKSAFRLLSAKRQF